MLTQEVRTELAPEEVIERAKDFFATRFSQGSGFLAAEGPRHVKFDFDMGELVIGAIPQGDRTLVRGSSSRLHRQVSLFLSTLAPPEGIRDNLLGPGVSGAG